MDIRELNNTNNTFDNGFRCTVLWPSATLRLIFCFFILVSSLVGNVLVVTIFCRDKTLRTTVNYFIVNMCVSDLIFPVIYLPLGITLDQRKSWLLVKISPAALCKTLLIALGVSLLVSLFSMTAIAADRFRAVIFPMKPALFSPKKCCAAIFAMWLSSFAIFIYHSTAVIFDLENVSCAYREGTSNGIIFFLTIFTLLCLFGVVISVFYLKVAIFLHRQKNNLHLASEVVKKRAKRNRKIITMLIIIVILFYVVYIPYVLVFLFYILNVSTPCILLVGSISPIIYPVINPVFYFAFNEKYRQGLRKIMCCLSLCNKNGNRFLQEHQVPNAGQENQAVDIIELSNKNN